MVSGGTPAKENADYWIGDIPWVSSKDMKVARVTETEDAISHDAVLNSATTMVPEGSMLLVARSGILKHSIPAAIAGRELTINQDIKGLIPQSDSIHSAYFRWIIDGFQTRLLVLWRQQGATVESLETESVQDTDFPLPPFPEQVAIADFLDRETAKIDGLIAALERLIALLEEKRQAVITHAVTKGLDPSVRMKDSGIGSLGEIPAHWESAPLKRRLLGIEQGWSPDCHARAADAEEWGVLKVGCVNKGEFDETENKALPEDLEPRPHLLIKPGDILVSRANTRDLVGSATVVLQTRPKLMLCDKLFRLQANDRFLDGRFAHFLLKSRLARLQFEIDATGASDSMKNIGQSTIMNMRVGLPPRDEQTAIARHLDKCVQQLSDAKAQAETLISANRERRAAIVSAAVTGQIDVRTAQCGANQIIESTAH